MTVLRENELRESIKGSSSDVDRLNASFWNELCGSSLARMLGIDDASAESLARFDDWYFEYYPYLMPIVESSALNGMRVLEVGLGFGSLSQKIAERGAVYTGLDIADGPVEMVNHRLSLFRLSGMAMKGNVLKCPFPDDAFDVVIAIGSLHHTGDFDGALREIHRVLRPGGRLIFMVYNTFSYRRWLYWPVSTLKHAAWAQGVVREKPVSSASERGAYDADINAVAAPETDFFSRSELEKRMDGWLIRGMHLHNFGDENFLSRLSRRLKLELLAPILGLDIYVSAEKR